MTVLVLAVPPGVSTAGVTAVGVTIVAMVIIVVVVVAVTVTELVAEGAAGAAAESCTDQAAGGAAHLPADDLAASCAQATADGGFGFLAVLGRHRTACRAANAGADRGTRTTTNGLTDHTPQSSADTTADRGVGGFAGYGIRAGHQGEQCDYRK